MASRPDSRNDGCAIALVAVVCLGFGAAAVAIVHQEIRNTWLQWRSLEYVAVPGTIAQSEAKTRKRTTEWKARYDYQVAGRAYSGTVVRHGGLGTASNALHRRLAKELPVGAATTVHYDPDDPGEAVLVPGFLPVDAVFPLMLLFFVQIGAWCLYLIAVFVLAKARKESVKDWLLVAKTVPRGNDRTVRLNFCPPVRHRLHAAFSATALAGLVIGLAGLFAFGEIEPTWSTVGAAWTVALSLGLVAALWTRPRYIRFRPDWRRIEVSGAERRTLDLDRYEGVDVEMRKTGTSKGKIHYAHDIYLRWKDEADGFQRTKLSSFGDAADARFAANMIDAAWREGGGETMG